MSKKGGPNSFEERFKDKISIINKDGTRTRKVDGEVEYSGYKRPAPIDTIAPRKLSAKDFQKMAKEKKPNINNNVASPVEEKKPTKEEEPLKKHKKVEYKPHTLSDYKMINMPIKLGGLGPDLNNEELKSKQEKVQKMKEYARDIAIANQNRTKTNADRIPSKDSNGFHLNKPSEDAAKSSRKKALEFAAKIPKPHIPKKETNVYHKKKELDSNGEDLSSVDGEPQPLSELELLEIRHQKEKEWMEREFGSEYFL